MEITIDETRREDKLFAHKTVHKAIRSRRSWKTHERRSRICSVSLRAGPSFLPLCFLSSTFHFRTSKKIKTESSSGTELGNSPLSSSSRPSSSADSSPNPLSFSALATGRAGGDGTRQARAPGALCCRAWIGFSFSRAYSLGKETLA
jgi:hypothetical protein